MHEAILEDIYTARGRAGGRAGPARAAPRCGYELRYMPAGLRQVVRLMRAAFVVVMVVAQVSGEPHANGGDTYLLLDKRNVISSVDVELVLGTVVKEDKNPLLTEQKPWELQFNNMQPSVWYDESDRKYKAWYNMFSTCEPATAKSCGGRGTNASVCDSNMGYDAKSRTGSLCYAESVDGLVWTKPGLNLVPFQTIPAADTNIVLGDALSAAQPLSGGYPTGNGVTLDEATTNPAEKWKMLGCRPKTMFSAYLATSADGKQWSNGTDFVAGRYDTALNVEFDDFSRRWLAFGRESRLHVKSKMHSTMRFQAVAVSQNDDFLGEWGTMLPTQLNTSTLGYQPDALVAFRYYGVFLGFANMLVLSANRTENIDHEQGGTVNAELVFSSDGRHWEYLKPGHSFIPLGDGGEWDSCSVFGAKQGFQSSQQRGGPNSSLSVYYAGCSGPFMGPRACSLGMAKMQRHGWAGLKGTSNNSWVQLAPAHVFAPSLRLTVDSAGTAGVRVAIKDDEECSFANSIPLIGTLSEHPVEWTSGGCDLGDYVGGAIRIQLQIAPGAIAFAYTI